MLFVCRVPQSCYRSQKMITCKETAGALIKFACRYVFARYLLVRQLTTPASLIMLMRNDNGTTATLSKRISILTLALPGTTSTVESSFCAMAGLSCAIPHCQRLRLGGKTLLRFRTHRRHSAPPQFDVPAPLRSLENRYDASLPFQTAAERLKELLEAASW
jgi:hypothetical protein